MSHQHDHADSHHAGHGHSDHGHADHGHGGHDHHHEPVSVSRMPHHDWRVWVAVIWMLIGMVFYVVSGDEQLNPNEPTGEPAVPAAAE